jgi:hypothetical protein
MMAVAIVLHEPAMSETVLSCTGRRAIIDGRAATAGYDMALVRLVDPEEADPIVTATLESGRARYGVVLNTWRALLHRPVNFTAYLPYLRAAPLDMEPPPPAVDAAL